MRKPLTGLSENHQRGLTTALVLLDEMLCEIEHFAQGRQYRSVFYVERNRLSPDHRTRLAAEVGRMRRLLRELQEDLELKPTIEDPARKIWGHASGFWEVLVEAQSPYLRRYGDVPPALANYLDPRLEKLISHLGTIVDIARQAMAAPEPREDPES